ncbi:MAG: hypothetical protein NTU63_03475 [Candidatus Pacearchaeota archaeon]|nr:hypothetical protein [Candidatus Pacearchaeota archaeon]
MRNKGGLEPTIFLKKNRRGQFYLIAAVIIIAVVVTVFTVSNYIERKESVQLYNLGEELGIESQNVLDYGTYNGFDENATRWLITDFVDSYVNYIGEGKNIYLLFGNKDTIKIMAYQIINESVSVSIDNGVAQLVQIDSLGEGSQEFSVGSMSKVVITIGGVVYEFQLKPGENFYFVISQKIGGEKYVVTSKHH